MRIRKQLMVVLGAGMLAAGGPGAFAASAASAAGAANGAVVSAPSAQPTYPSVPGRFYSVAATSAHDIWAAGLGPSGTLIEHWNGKAWAQSLESAGYFNAVGADSPSDAWAVGGTNWFSPCDTLTEHWNGKTWTQVASQTPGGWSGYFAGVAATSPRSAWAVGLLGDGGNGVTGFTSPLIEHWNGKRWTLTKYPVPQDGGGLKGVTALSPDNVWAVGWIGNGSATGQLILHWNGKTWTRVNLHVGLGALSGVAATSASNAWAVGQTPVGTSLIIHWNGRRWRRQRSPSPVSTNLWAVAATSPASAWAVGYTNPVTCNPSCATVAFHWNGRRWSAVPTPDPPANLDALLDVTAISPRNAWAVGVADSWANTLIIHWNGRRWAS